MLAERISKTLVYLFRFIKLWIIADFKKLDTFMLCIQIMNLLLEKAVFDDPSLVIDYLFVVLYTSSNKTKIFKTFVLLLKGHLFQCRNHNIGSTQVELKL